MKRSFLCIGMAIISYCAAGQALSSKDRQFIDDAAQSGLLEIKLGELAQSKAASAGVKAFGKLMVSDHTKANNGLMSLATKKAIALPAVLDKENQRKYDGLSKKSGAAFDRAYAGMMVAGHKKAVEMFKAELSSGSDEDVRSWASVTLPSIEHHLSMAEDMNKK